MKLTLHHINFCSDDLERLNGFYTDVMGLETGGEGLPDLERTKGFIGDVAFVNDGTIQYHLTRRDILLSFGIGQNVNPVARGHIAFRTDDIAAFKAHLEEKGVPYADWGDRAVKGWHQVFFFDPDGTVIEVHQVMDAEKLVDAGDAA